MDKRGTRAWFNSDAKPYDVSAAASIAGDRLFVAFRTGDANLLKNSGDTPNALFKTGGALDVMLGTDVKAPANRLDAVAGDLRLLVSVVNKKPVATLYRAVVPGTAPAARVPFSTPWRTIHFDRVEDVSSQLQFAGADGNYEFSIPLNALGLTPAEGMVLQADLGVLRGNGFETVQRAYWSNKAAAITADVPSEALLAPELWGRWRIEKRREAPLLRHGLVFSAATCGGAPERCKSHSFFCAPSSTSPTQEPRNATWFQPVRSVTFFVACVRSGPPSGSGL